MGEYFIGYALHPEEEEEEEVLQVRDYHLRPRASSVLDPHNQQTTLPLCTVEIRSGKLHVFFLFH